MQGVSVVLAQKLEQAAELCQCVRYNDAMHEPLMAHARSGTQLFLLGTLSLALQATAEHSAAPMSLIRSSTVYTQT